MSITVLYLVLTVYTHAYNNIDIKFTNITIKTRNIISASSIIIDGHPKKLFRWAYVIGIFTNFQLSILNRSREK